MNLSIKAASHFCSWSCLPTGKFTMVYLTCACAMLLQFFTSKFPCFRSWLFQLMQGLVRPTICLCDQSAAPYLEQWSESISNFMAKWLDDIKSGFPFCVLLLVANSQWILSVCGNALTSWRDSANELHMELCAPIRCQETKTKNTTL